MTTESPDEYYRRTTGWAVRRQADEARSRRLAWTIAIAACGIIAMMTVALVLLTPLKTVEPVTLLVDRQTGYVQALKPLEPERLSGDGALTQSFLVQYVIAREGFDRATVQRDYRKVALWSSGKARDAYLGGMATTNPDSPLTRLPPDAVVEVQVKSVTPIGTGLAQVRFSTHQNDRKGPEADRDWVAIIGYRYSDAPMEMEDRFLNPLGFQVTRYRRAAEALPAYRDPDPTPLRSATTMPIQPTASAVTTYRQQRADVRNVVIIRPEANVPMGSPLVPTR